MAYNYGPPPGAYGARQPAYPTPQHAQPPYGAPPAFDTAPGIPGQTPPNPMQAFQPPANMPNINFNAPVIRLGVDGGPQAAPRGAADRLTGGGTRGSNSEPLGNRGRLGLGAERERGGGDSRTIERDRAAVRESMLALQPPTREEVARTIFVGGLVEGVPSDAAIETLLHTAGKLRRWTRARDAEDKKCKFGFAEYEDVESLEAAAAIFAEGIEVPLFEQDGVTPLRDADTDEVKKATLLVVVDEQSKTYISDWTAKRKEDPDSRQFRLDGAREDLRSSITRLTNTAAVNANANLAMNGSADDTHMPDAPANENGQVLTIPLTTASTLEDDLADIPPEMRATVAEEIRSFRDRSTRRDIERLRREEELEQRERAAASRTNRPASPPAPAGPRNAPSGPKGYRGAQMPADYVNGVAFVNGNGNGMHPDEDEGGDESDEELERRRREKRRAELEKQYLDAERRWQNRARTRAAAQERERLREEAERREMEREKDMIRKRLGEWDDEAEKHAKVEEYYSDRSNWNRRRVAYREREAKEDERERMLEDREKGVVKPEELRDAKIKVEESAPQQQQQQQGFKISLGSAAARTKAAAAAAAPTAPNRRAMADVEGLLEDEEDAAASGLRTKPLELKPLPSSLTNPAQNQDLADDERATLRQELAAEIPTTSSALFSYPIKYEYLTEAVLDRQIRPFVEKKVVEYLGVQEELLVEVVMGGLRERRRAGALVEEVGEALEEEAEVLVRKVWRLVVFWSEVGARGLE